LGTDISQNTKFSKNFPVDKLSNELIVSLTIDNKGKVSGIIKEKGVDTLIDDSVMKFLKKTKWNLQDDSQNDQVKMTFRFRFILVKAELI
jgi:hypothetical protein